MLWLRREDLFTPAQKFTEVLQFARVMDTSNLGSDVVGLFRKVEITNTNTQAHMAYTIVNPHEANLSEGKISIKSPIASALLGKKVGDIVEVHVPSGILHLKIDGISI